MNYLYNNLKRKYVYLTDASFYESFNTISMKKKKSQKINFFFFYKVGGIKFLFQALSQHKINESTI